MKDRLSNNEKQLYIRLYIKRLWEERWFKALSCLAAVVVFCTFYALILPAITLEADTVCGKSAHLHSEECYEARQDVVCYKDEHIHSESCYEMCPAVICGQEELLPHTHDNGCYLETSTLVCEQDEDETHTHTGECYQLQSEFVCGLMEEEGHVHDDSCFELVSTLVCSFDEHRHDEDCSAADKLLVCKIEEHQHTELCLEAFADDPDTDGDIDGDTGDGVGAPSDWGDEQSGILKSGNWAKDFLDVAEMQIGYRESESNHIITDNGQLKGYTKYGEWYGEPYGDWNVMFISFCLHVAGVSEFPIESDFQDWIDALNLEPYQYYCEKESYTPTPGDLVFFDLNGDRSADHVGIVKTISEKGDSDFQIVTIEGDVDNCVRAIPHDLSGSEVLGFAQLPINPDGHTETELGENDEVVDASGDAAVDLDNKNGIVLHATTEGGIIIAAALPDEMLSNKEAEFSLSVSELQNDLENEKTLAVLEAISSLLVEKGRTAEKITLFEIAVLVNGEEVAFPGEIRLTVEESALDSALFLSVRDESVSGFSVTQKDVLPAEFVVNGASILGIAVLTPVPLEQETMYQDVVLSGVTEDGLLVTVSGPSSSFPENAEGLELRVQNMNEAVDDLEAMEAFERLQENLDEAGVGSRSTWLLDISLWQDGCEVEPLGPVTVGVSGVEEEISMIYHVEESEVTEISSFDSDEADVAFSTDHFSLYGLVAVNALGTRGTTSLTVEKTWADFWKAHGPVTVRLQRTDSAGNTTEVSGVTPLVLSAQNNWKGTFSNLPSLSAGESYSVVEDVPSGYRAQYGVVEELQATGGQYWVPARNSTLVSGNTYVFRVSNQNFVLGQSTTTQSRMIRTSATVRGSVTVNGATYANHFAYEDIPAGAQWTVTASGNYFKFQNGRGYSINEDVLTTSLSRATRMSFTSGRIRCIDEDNEMLYWNGSSYSLNERSYETFQLYELVSIPASGVTYKTTITNKPMPEPNSETLTVRKVWSDPWESHDPVTVHLMCQDENGLIVAGDTVTLSQTNGWTDTFTDLSSNEDGSFPYSVYETPVDSYVTVYGTVEETAGTGGDVWLPVTNNQIIDGQTYVLYARGGAFAQVDPGYQYIQTAAVTMNGSISFDGVTYSNYLSDVPAGAQWTASEFGSYFQLRNGNLRYLGGAGGYFAETSEAHGYTFNNGKLYDVNTGRYIFWNSTSYQSTTNSGSAQTFQLYVKIDASAGGGGHEITITNTKVYPQQKPIDPDLEIHKQIDYLGDKVANPDTGLSGPDDYRLYLDVIGSHQPVDLLIVADVTDSMNQSYGNTTRAAALDAIVNGTILSGNGANATRDTNGIIYNFLQMHEDNKVAVVCFSGGNNYCGGSPFVGSPNGHLYTDVIDICSPITKGWTGRSGFTTGNGSLTPRSCYCRVTRLNETSGTNYEIALKRATQILEDPIIKDNGHIKVMIFLTDGEPNVNIINGRIYKNETNDAAKQAMRDHTKDEFVSFLEEHPGLITYIVGVSTEANSGVAYDVLTTIADRGHATYYPADTVDQMRTALQSIIDNSKLSLVEITDTLSDYVVFNNAQPDIKVTRTDKNGAITTVWLDNAPTTSNYDAHGVRIINSVQYESDSKRVRVVFNPECYLDGDNTFTLSFNVRLSDYANQQYFLNGYSAVGDLNTDYGTNQTSTSKAGFFSNSDAFVTFTAYNVGYREEYSKPVVQSRILKFRIDKVSANDTDVPLAGAKFDLYRQADQNEPGAMLLPTLSNVFGVKINLQDVVTGTSGSTEIQSLMPGRYFLVETDAPEGYYAPGKPMAFDISSGDGIRVIIDPAYADNASAGIKDTDDVFHLTVRNQTSHLLPNTGGIGAQPVISSGLLLSAGALICGHMRCRRERRQGRK